MTVSATVRCIQATENDAGNASKKGNDFSAKLEGRLGTLGRVEAQLDTAYEPLFKPGESYKITIEGPIE